MCIRTPMVMSNSIEKGMKTFTDAPKEVQSQYIDPRPQLSEGERLVQSSAEVNIQYYVSDERKLL